MPISKKCQLSAGPAGSPSRRSVLRAGAGATALTAAGAAVGAAGLTACSNGQEGTAADGSRGNRLRARAAEDAAALIAAYDATLRAHPDLEKELRPLRADLVLHLEAFGGHGTPSSASSSPGASDVPDGAVAAKRALARTERRTADARTADLLDAPPELARLLASVAASGAGRALLLRS
ncbi:hypothetical protein [Wenjunlia tyrosinilytica]|uniref:Lipoprotein n=1 Tax=Wenjunlia tyrosinilytica TaxID=1544741 RepID=A0A917ZUY3_9ACTN|nr:hypothetical protein [Wenjunlia tyrosinilytica]GGO93572.1 hypothetical protein GCM10012280_46390 [Wenjunlia tyrosinilytica]